MPAGKGVGPSAVGRLVRDRSVRLAAGLAITVAIPVAIMFYFQFRSLSDLGQASAVVLRQLSQETADAVTKDLQDALRAPRTEVILKIFQYQTEPLDLPFIQTTFSQGLDTEPFVDGFYVWSEATTEHRNDLLSFDRDTRRFVTNPPETALLLGQFNAMAPAQRAIAVFEASLNGRATYFLAQLRFTFPSRDRMTSFVALRVDAERLRTTFIPQLVAKRLAKVEGPTGFPPLDVTVLDSDKRVIFPAGGSAPTRFVDERTFPLVFYEADLTQLTAPTSMTVETWRVRTGYRDQTIPGIVAARARPQRMMMAILAGVMALGVFFVARALARELRVAEMKSSFVSSVSHDLKTPLALIQLFAETLELGRLKNTDRAQEYYRIINSEARKLTRLINNLLDFSKIEAGLRSYKKVPVDLTELTRGVLESLESQFQHNQFTVRRPPRRRGAGADRQRGGGAGDREPDLERHEILARAPRDYGRGRPRRRLRRRPRGRSRHRRAGAAAEQDLPQVLPGPDRRRVRPARHRTRARHRRSRDAGPCRLRAREQRARIRQHVHAPFPVVRRRDSR